MIRACFDEEREWVYVYMAVGLSRICWILTPNEASALADEIRRELATGSDRGAPVMDA